MNLIIRSLCAVAALCLYGACASDTLSESDLSAPLETFTEVENNSTLAEKVMDLVNEHRASVNLEPLLWHTDSEELATDHSFYMVQRNQASHDNFFERSEILKSRGADSVSENVAYGYITAESLLQGWLASPSHRSAIEGDYTHSGIGIVQTENGIPYYTQLFIR